MGLSPEGSDVGSRVVVSKSGKVRSRWSRGWRVLLALLIGLVLLTVAGLGIAYAVIRVPSPNEVAQSETSIYYYADGETELGRTSTVNRVSVPLEQIPEDLQNAVLAAEDRSFYDNPGISVSGLGRAVWAALTGGPTQGGSTITQQYVKNYFLSHDQTLTRKARELVISVKVEQELSKPEILANYLNTIYFGRSAYGVQAAAQGYFGKDVNDLDLSESVFMASIIQSPGNYDPVNGPEARARLDDRMSYVVDGMVDEGWLSASRARSVEVPTTVEPGPQDSLSGPEGYVVAAARDELIYRVGLSEAEVQRGGLRVTTTVSAEDQEDLVTAATNNNPGVEGIRAGAASVQPGDGAILALYGGSDYAENPYSSAMQVQLQAGSTFKVFTVAAALEQGISTRTVFDGDSPRTFGPEVTKGPAWEVRNFQDEDFGPVTVRQALAESVNTSFAELNLQVGAENTERMMVKLGIPESSPGLAPNPANVFGTASVRVIDLANAYATIAAGGVRAEPYIVKNLTSNDGRLEEYTAGPTTSRVIDEAVAADTIDAMRAVVTDGTGSRAQAVGHPSAGKTGTSDENRAIWYGGFTPQASTAVAIYLPDENGSPQPLQGIAGSRGLTGSTYPLSIWVDYMRRFMDGRETIPFPDRVGIGDSGARTAPQPGGDSEGNSDDQPSGDPANEDSNGSDGSNGSGSNGSDGSGGSDEDSSPETEPTGGDQGGENSSGNTTDEGENPDDSGQSPPEQSADEGGSGEPGGDAGSESSPGGGGEFDGEESGGGGAEPGAGEFGGDGSGAGGEGGNPNQPTLDLATPSAA